MKAGRSNFKIHGYVIVIMTIIVIILSDCNPWTMKLLLMSLALGWGIMSSNFLPLVFINKHSYIRKIAIRDTKSTARIKITARILIQKKRFINVISVERNLIQSQS